MALTTSILFLTLYLGLKLLFQIPGPHLQLDTKDFCMYMLHTS